MMATRGRESNRLYVDTAFDPDHATSHEQPEHADPVDVLHTAIANTSADTSASEARRQEQAAAWAPRRLEAQGAWVAASERGRSIAD